MKKQSLYVHAIQYELLNSRGIKATFTTHLVFTWALSIGACVIVLNRPEVKAKLEGCKANEPIRVLDVKVYLSPKGLE